MVMRAKGARIPMFSNFLPDRPELKDKLFACAVFSGIAVGGMAGVETVVTGGFDFVTPGREIRQTAPSNYVEIAPATLFEQAQAIPLTSREPLFSGRVTTVSETLDGSYDVAPATSHYPAAQDDGGDVLYRQLAARYDAQASQSVQRVQPAVHQPAAADSLMDSTAASADSGAAGFNAVEQQVLQAVPANLVEQKPAA